MIWKVIVWGFEPTSFSFDEQCLRFLPHQHVIISYTYIKESTNLLCNGKTLKLQPLWKNCHPKSEVLEGDLVIG